MNPVNLINFMDNGFLAYQALDHIISSNREDPNGEEDQPLGKELQSPAPQRQPPATERLLFGKPNLSG
ncbi:hypothetical protein PSHT_02585 [Puccinia striiformis]|uniref:Uncharacterized protein n=1 Tax=Puccinia striiformis TaxID=27350 RepID=A0A2S4WHS3_9BASI|nr:hypothetical protein PSHT_02585 [Puccinia striiformis]